MFDSGLGDGDEPAGARWAAAGARRAVLGSGTGRSIPEVGMRSLSRWLPLVAALASLTALTPGAASAQPACVPAIIDDYIDLLATGPGGGCRVGPLTFSDFVAVPVGGTEYVEPRGRVFLAPVERVVMGRRFVGFTAELRPPFATDWADALLNGDCGGAPGECYLDVRHTQFGFRAAGTQLMSFAAAKPVGEALAIGDWDAAYGVGVNAVPDPTQPPLPGVQVFHGVFTWVCSGGTPRCPVVAETEGRSPVDRYEAYLEAWVRNTAPGPAGEAFAIQYSGQVLFGLVPEPSAVALLATGLLALGVGACRRRGRHTLWYPTRAASRRSAAV